MAAPDTDISVLCVDDNEQVANALRMKFGSIGGFEWRGWLPAADALVPTVVREKPGIVLLDIDMPGRDPFEALSELTSRCPRTRVVVFTGHVRRDLVDRALDAGAWGYVSKNDGEESLVRAVRQVVAGELALSPEARMSCDSG